MNLDFTPICIANFSSIIGVNSPHHIYLANSQATHCKIYLYVSDQPRNTMQGIAPVKTLTQTFYNQYSYTVDVTPYLRKYVTPSFGDIYAYDEWGNGEKWFCYKVVYYNGNVQLSTIDSRAYFLTAGWKYEEVGTHYPHTDSNGNTDVAFLSDTNAHQLLQTPFNNDSLGFTSQYLLSHISSGVSTKLNCQIALLEYNTNLNFKCDESEYEVMFINHCGAWQLMPLFGKVVQNVTHTKEAFKITAPKYNGQYTTNKVGVNKQTSTIKYNWTSGSMDEMMSIYIEDIIYSPLIILVDTKTGNYQHVNVLTSNYSKLTQKNNRGEIRYSIEFTSQLQKIKQ